MEKLRTKLRSLVLENDLATPGMHIGKHYAKADLKMLWVFDAKQLDDRQSALFDILNDQAQLPLHPEPLKSYITKLAMAILSCRKNAHYQYLTQPNVEIDVANELQYPTYIALPSADDEPGAALIRTIVQGIAEVQPDIVVFVDTYSYFEAYLAIDEMKNFGSCRAMARKGRIDLSIPFPDERTDIKDLIDEMHQLLSSLEKHNKKLKAVAYSRFREDMVYLEKLHASILENIRTLKQNYIKGKDLKRAAICASMEKDQMSLTKTLKACRQEKEETFKQK